MVKCEHFVNFTWT